MLETYCIVMVAGACVNALCNAEICSHETCCNSVTESIKESMRSDVHKCTILRTVNSLSILGNENAKLKKRFHTTSVEHGVYRAWAKLAQSSSTT